MIKKDQNKRNILFWISFMVLVGLYFLVKIGSPMMIERAHDAGTLNWLNNLIKIQQNQSLGYYMGEIEAKLTGPFGVILSSLLFLVFALRFLKNSNAKIFAAAVFVFLIATKFDVMLFPPYGDSVGGPFAEAIWLYQNSFDYVGLFNQTRYIDGGPAVYVFSIYPTYLAVLMKVFSSSKWFLIVNHLLVFGFASVIIAVFREILLKVFDKRTAVLSLVVFMSLPLFQSQVEAINMEMFLLLFAILSVFYLIQKKVMQASIFAALAVFTKGYGAVVCATVVLSSFALFFSLPRGERRVKTLLWGMFAGVAAAGAIFLAYIVAYQFTPTNVTQIFSGWPSLRNTFTLKIYIFSLLLYLWKVILYKKNQAKEQGNAEPFLLKNFTSTVMFMFAGVWFSFFLNHFAVSPRYSLILLPFLIFCGVFAFLHFDKKSIVVPWIMIIVIVVAAFCSYGIFYGQIDGYNYVLQERSLEYRNDLKLSLQVAKELESNYDNLLIGAPFPVAQMLAFPELGYVQKKLNIMIYRMPCTYGNIKNFQGLKYLDLSRTIWVGVKSGLPASIPFPVDPQDIVIKEFVQGRENATIFQGGIAIERARLMLEYIVERKLGTKK